MTHAFLMRTVAVAAEADTAVLDTDTLDTDTKVVACSSHSGWNQKLATL